MRIDPFGDDYDAQPSPPSPARTDDAAHAYLSRLLTSCAPKCEPLPDLMGVCTQIDNLLTGLRSTPAPRDEVQEVAPPHAAPDAARSPVREPPVRRGIAQRW